MKRILLPVFALALVAVLMIGASASADSSAINFESGYALGNINAQNGWSNTGAYDVEVENVADYANASSFGFATTALRISNGFADGAFGGQAFAPQLAQPATESANSHYEASFEIGSTMATQQVGLANSFSPDTGNGSRMSYLRFVDQADGIHVFFDDATNAGPLGTESNFNETDIATITRTAKHTIRFSIFLAPGAGNDLVRIYIDSVLVKTGTTWEDYYRFDPEASGSGNVVPDIDTMLFRAGGASVPANSGNGFLIDNFTYSTTAVTQCTTTCYVDAVNGNNAFGGTSVSDAKKTIQTAIDTVSMNGTVRVLPGSYDETAANRDIGHDVGAATYQFGLFFPMAKPGITVMGVTSGDAPITDATATQATMATNATNNFGTSGIFVDADNTTIKGIKIGSNAAGDNKTIEVVADNFTLQHSKTSITGGGSVYINDWSTAGDVVKAYHVLDNAFTDGTSVDISSGAGSTGLLSTREIKNNVFDLNDNGLNGISFNGSGTTVPWYLNTVGGAQISGNDFSNSTQYIRSRGNVVTSEFDWGGWFSGNSFETAVMTGPDPANDNLTGYTYACGSYSCPNTKRIGALIQGEVDHAATNDKVLAKAGTYLEQVVITMPLTLTGAGAGSTILDGVNDTGVGIAIQNAANVTVEDLKVTRFDRGLTVGIGGSSAASGVVIEDVDAVNNGNHGLMSGTFDLNGLRITRGNYSDNGTSPSNPNNNGRGIWLIDENKTNITIEDVTASNNQLVGIDLNDGDVSGLVIEDNTVVGNGDAGISVTGAEGPGTTVIDDNTVTNNGRYGIELKVPNGSGLASGAGSIVVSDNTINRSAVATDARDYAGIAVVRRAGNPSFNADQPTGVVITGNTVSNIIRKPSGSTGDGFGIIVEGTNHNVNHNTVTGNNVGIQAQRGNTANVQSTDFFDRGDAASFGGTINRNSIDGNDLGFRAAGLASAANVECNWWGDSTGPSTVGTGSGDTVSANADFISWLVTSNLDSGCTGTPQEITVTDAAGHNFGSQNVAAGATAPFTFTVTNDGAINLAMGTVTITGSSASHYAIDTDNCGGVTLAPGTSCTIDVIFDPSTTGPKSATLNIASNDSDENPTTRALTGTGTTGPTTGTIKIVLDAAPNSSQNFGFTGDTGSFALDDDNNNTLPSSRTVTLAPGMYDVTQGTVAGWSLTGLACNTGESTSIPTRTATITLTAGENVVCTFTDTHRRADALVSKKASSKYAGNNIYSSTVLASQTRNLAVARNATKKLFFRFQNESLATDSFTIDANLSGSPSFSVSFFSGATDITAAVLAGTYSINLASGAQVTIEARITAASNTTANATRNIDVFQTSTSQPSIKDVVRGHITRS